MQRLLLAAAIALFIPGYAVSGSFDIKLGLGTGFYFGDTENLEDGVRWQMLPVILDLGYSVTESISLDLEGQFWWHWGADIGHPSVFFGSVVGYYHFVSEDTFVTPYALVGLGYGYVLFFDKETDDNGGSGHFQFQLGGGVAFDINDWLDLGVETRLRLGFPMSPDIVTMALLCVVMVSL